tara:strand:+ start:210 stop:587 length:378 start_codon:yes stop_codon:yes gene_type:complete
MNKDDTAYKSIGEVAKLLNLVNPKDGKPNTHTIRFWEKEFKQLKPKKLSGNRRYYDQKALSILKNIKFLLKEKGLTINGARKILDNPNAIKLDEDKKNSISVDSKNIKNKLINISNLIKDIKKIK